MTARAGHCPKCQGIRYEGVCRTFICDWRDMTAVEIAAHVAAQAKSLPLAEFHRNVRELFR